MNSIRDYTAAAQMAYDSGIGSPYLSSSNMDEAHYVGLWARAKGIYPQEVSKSSGYKMKLNRKYSLDFKNSDQNPEVSTI